MGLRRSTRRSGPQGVAASLLIQKLGAARGRRRHGGARRLADGDDPHLHVSGAAGASLATADQRSMMTVRGGTARPSSSATSNKVKDHAAEGDVVVVSIHLLTANMIAVG